MRDGKKDVEDILTEQQIFRLEISVDNSLPVEIFHRRDDTAEIETGGGVIKPTCKHTVSWLH